MKQHYLIAMACCCIIIIAGCSGTGITDKMPITTSSEKALEYYVQGRDLVEKLRGQESRQYFQKAIDEDPDFAVAHLQLAAVQPSAKAFFDSFYKAKDLMDKVSEAERQWILGFEAGGIKGDLLAQQELYKKLVEAYPNDERARNLLATNYFAQQKWQMAIEEYERAAQINPEFSPLYNQMGYTYRFLERYDKAEEAFRKYIKLIPDDPNPYDSYAELLMKTGRYEESIEQYRAALAIRPDFVASHIGIATDLNFLNRHQQAREQLQTMYDGAKDDGQRRLALNNMAFSFIDEGRFDEALEQYQKAYAIAEAIGDTAAMAGDLAIMGFALVEVEGREGEALDKFEKATAMVQASSLSESTKALNRLGHFYNASRAYIAMGDLEKARSNASEYSRRADSVGNLNQIRAAHQLVGLICLKDGDYELAITELMQSSQQNPFNIYHIGKAYESKGNRVKAKEYYEKAANYNGLNNSPQACIRAKATELAAAM